jgi:hypothetical protein
MMRVQVQLTPGQHRRLRQRARRLGVSVAEVVRRAVDVELASSETDSAEDRARRALAVCGKYTDPRGPSDMARNHDAALADAYGR